MKGTSANLFTRKHAIAFVVLFGIVSLFSDMTYQGARSIIGPYLATLGASAAVVGFVAGFGELVGYSLRLLFGYLADKTKQYWVITICGYALNLIAVPLMAATQHWPAVAALIVLERLGKSVRVPSRDAMLSQAGQTVGMGWGFGLHQAFDQIGAMLGPFLIAAALFFKEGYRFGFAILAIPAALALVALCIAYSRYPNPENLAIKINKIETPIKQKAYWLYLVGAALVAFGYADFPLIAYHFQKSHILTPTLIPIAYGIAMGVDAIAAPLSGKLYDKYGLWILCFVVLLTASFAPLVFLGGIIAAFVGVAVWAIGMGVQASIMRAVIGDMTPSDKRGSAYGTFNLIYGISWFAGSALLGVIYDHSLYFTVIFVIVAQLISLPWFFMTMLLQKRVS